MDIKALYVQYCKEFWDFFLPSDLARDRKGITFEQWRQRTPAARKAMYLWLKENDAPKKNPFFWVQDFPDPVPTDYNGCNGSLPTDQPLVIALYKGKAGIYARQDAEDFEMEIKQPFIV